MHSQGRHSGGTQQAGEESSCTFKGMFRAIEKAIAADAGREEDIESVHFG